MGYLILSSSSTLRAELTSFDFYSFIKRLVLSVGKPHTPIKQKRLKNNGHYLLLSNRINIFSSTLNMTLILYLKMGEKPKNLFPFRN